MKIPVKKIIKWAGLIGTSGVLIIGLILAVAYWNRDFIIEKTKEELNKGIKGELTIGKIDFTVFHQFPSFSVTLHQVTFKDSLTHYNTFAAGKIFLKIDFYQLLKKEINIKSFSVDDAEVNFFRAPNGDTNTDIFKSSATTEHTDEESSFALTLPAFDLQHVKFAYVDSVRNKSYRFKFINTKNTLKHDSSGYDMRIAGDMYFDELVFNQEAGGFLVDKEAEVDLHVQLPQQDTTLMLLPSMLQFGHQQLEVSGNFELIRQGNYKLLFQADNILLADGKALLNDKLNKILDKYSLDQPIDATVSLAGKFIPDYKPAVEVRFQSAHATFNYGKMEVDNLTLAGAFIQKADTTKSKGHPDAWIEVSSFTGEIEAVPFKGKVTFTQLYDPVMDLSMESKLNYTDLFSMVDTSRFVPRSGNFSTAFRYQGKLDEYLDPNRTHYEGKLEGKIRVSEGALYYKPKHFFFDKVNAVFNFNEKQFSINKLAFRINESPIEIQGVVKNFIPFFITPEDKGFVNVEVTSPTLDLTPLFAKRNERPLTDQQAAQQRKKMTDLIDMVYKKLEFEVAVKANEVTFRKFKSENIIGKVKLTENTIASDGIDMDVAEGTTHLSFKLSELEKKQSLLAVEANVKDANIREFFLYFDNFNQDAVVADNLTGFISTEVTFNALVDDNYSVIPPTMRGSINSKILNGGLLNFEPLENVGNFLFRKRDFSDIQFAQLNSNFTIDGTALDISRMEIQSTVLTLFLQGRYSFSDSTNLSVQLPLSNLKKRHKDYKPENIGVDADAGPSVFLHVYRYDDPKSKMNIAYDPFKKWAKRIGER